MTFRCSANEASRIPAGVGRSMASVMELNLCATSSRIRREEGCHHVIMIIKFYVGMKNKHSSHGRQSSEPNHPCRKGPSSGRMARGDDVAHQISIVIPKRLLNLDGTLQGGALGDGVDALFRSVSRCARRRTLVRSTLFSIITTIYILKI